MESTAISVTGGIVWSYYTTQRTSRKLLILTLSHSATLFGMPLILSVQG